MKFELFGLPGCGKSTCCRKIEESTKIGNPMKFYKENFLGKIFFHLFLLTFQVNNKLNRLYKECLQILGTETYENAINKAIPKELYLKYMMFIYHLENSKKVIIIDEGIIHYAIALHAEFHIEMEKIERIVQLLQGKEIKRFGILATVEECMGFIQKRNRKNCSIDFLEKEDLKQMLYQYKEGLDYFSQKYEVKTIESIVDYIKSGEGRNEI